MGADIWLRLIKYASAQAAELALAQSLNGDPSHDSSILATLVSDVTTGIQLNKNNTLLASLSDTLSMLKLTLLIVRLRLDAPRHYWQNCP